jgi:hypothetical protein
LEQQSGGFVAVTMFALPIVGQRKVARQTTNKAVALALRMTFQVNSGLIQIKARVLNALIAGRK